MRVPRTSFRNRDGEAPAEPNASLERLNRSFALPGALTLLLACGGCWEEIRYVPKTGAVQTANENGEKVPEEPAVAASLEPEIAEPAVADPLAAAAEVPPTPDADELFSPEGPAEIAMEPAENDVATPDVAPAEDSILPTPDRLAATLESSASEEEEGAETGTDLLVVAPTSDERRLAWEAASKWSLAAAFHAKGLDRLRQTNLDEASAAAAQLRIELPPLPTTPQPGDLEATVIEGLRGESAVSLTNAFARRFGPAEASAADLAIRSRLLLLTYTPRSGDAALQAESLRRAAEASRLPADVWEQLVGLLDERAPFVAVRQAVFELDDRIAQHFGDADK